MCHFGARFSAAWWGRTGAVLIRICHQRRSWQRASAVFLHLLGCPISWHKVVLGRQVNWIGIGINTSSCFWQKSKEKSHNALNNIHKVYRQGRKIDRADLERLVGLLMWFSVSMPALRPWISVFFLIWSWRNPMLHCCHFSNIQFQEAISRPPTTLWWPHTPNSVDCVKVGA